MNIRFTITAIIAICLLGGIFGLWYHNGQLARAAMVASAAPPPTVSTVVAEAQTWNSTRSAFGTLESRAGILVRAEAEGRVLRVAFASGDKVAAGDLLVELDAAIEEAQLKGLEAAATLAKLQLDRARDLRAAYTNSEADLDLAEAQYAEALAAVEHLQALIAKKRVVAPFSGRLGIVQVDEGQFLDKGTGIVQLEAVDPIYVDFALPEREVGQVMAGMVVRVSVDAFPGRVFPGRIEAVNPRVDETTRNVRIRATLPNHDELLRAGMSARVAVDLPDAHDVIVLPSSSIVYNTYGNAVYVLNESEVNGDGTELIARQQFVEVGMTRGSQVSILDGLKVGDQVVTSGQIKLRNGIPVRVNNSVTPSSDPEPRPPES